METAKIDQGKIASDEMPAIIEMGRVSEETKGQVIHFFESPMFPSTLG